ncbi:hypothetical protein, variant 1 [Aphanomyces astaci]|nr:hypothetical protein, variant 1 [Aphanomyces astaci]ETV66815.1 hypothetical protein, variant 1 [Aphanomyces astaci]|eukprot:XP_009843792.1 hypothetical protein, variant 1 [Aphanomyces astaci]
MQSRGDPVLPVGAIVAASDVLSDVRSHDNLRGDWVPSVYCYYNEATHEMVYQFNQATGFGWHYGWVGTAKTSHRSTQHVLIGYLFRHVATSSQEPKFCVVASTSSPPFLVMSYRRACAFCQKLRTVSQIHCTCEGDLNLRRAKPLHFTPLAAHLRLPVVSPSLVVLAPSPETMEARLHAVYTLLSRPSVRAFAPYAELVHRLLHTQLKSILSLEKDLVLFHWFPLQPEPAPSEPPLASMAPLLEGVVLGLFTASQSKWREEAAANLLDRQALYQGYTAWLRHMYDAIGGHLGRVTWAELVNQSQQTIPSHSSGCFEYFVAQMREVFMAVEPYQLKERRPDCSLNLVSDRSFQGSWIYDPPPSTGYLPLSHSMVCPGFDLSLASLLRSLTMSYSVTLTLGPSSFYISSHLSLWPAKPAEFIVDGMAHICRVFPNGESSMSDLHGFVLGDYTASCTPHSIRLCLFSWPTLSSSPPTASYRLTLHAISPVSSQDALQVTVLLTASHVPNRLLRSHIDLMDMTASERIGLFASTWIDQSNPLAAFDMRYRRRRQEEDDEQQTRS